MTIEEIIEQNESFFSKENMRWFRSRVSRKVHEGRGGIFFVTSELRRRISSGARDRIYSVRGIGPSGEIRTTGLMFSTYHKAHSAAKKLAGVWYLDADQIDGWTGIQDDKMLMKVMYMKPGWVRRDPDTGTYMMPKWVVNAMRTYEAQGFAGLTEEEFLKKMA